MPSSNPQLLHTPTIQPPRTSLPVGGEDQILSLEHYNQWYKQSIEDPATFWGDRARKMLDWSKPFETTMQLAPNFSDAPAFFLGGELNACYNCVDRHAIKDPHRVAFIYEADEPGQGYKLTYGELMYKVCQVAGYLRSLGVKKGDIVTVYMPMCPNTLITLLAIIRLGAIHSVVFAGFSPAALRDRIQDANSTILITSDQGVRGGKKIELKKLADEALSQCPDVKTVVVLKKTGSNANWVEGRDVDFAEYQKFPNYIPPVNVGSEDPLFLLYTSGSTGKPKGLQHCTAGFLLCTMMSNKHTFGISPGDIFFCAADIGWVTGHAHAFYGPLLNGVTTVIFESTPVYPDETRLWSIIQEHKVTQLYTAPTAIRLLRKFGAEKLKKFDLSSLRVLGTVGEPISDDVWMWYYENVGGKRCSVVDTYWLTESAMILLTALPGVSPMRPGGAGLPFFGVKPRLVDGEGKEITERSADGILTIAQPWPSLARTVRNDHKRYKETYLHPFPGSFFTGDGASIDETGFTFVTGRVDDVVNVSGHRLSTSEVEAGLLHARFDGKSITTESAVIGVEDPVTGQALIAFCILNQELKDASRDSLTKETIATIRSNIGPFAQPKVIFFVSDLPKTRSGKIMRRILRKIVHGDKDLGELSTLNNPECIDQILQTVNASKQDAPQARL